jgi:hypothetical protein
MRFDNSQDCTISQLDLFTIPNTQSVLNEGVGSLYQLKQILIEVQLFLK